MKSRNTIAVRVRNLLSKVGYDFDKIDVNSPRSCEINVEAIAKNLEISVVPHPFKEDISGLLFRENGKLFLGVNSGHTVQRQRFTIAHEIGHYILHASEKIHYDTKDDLEQVYFRADSISGADEIQANQFAAELLMPKELVEKCVKSGILIISVLAERFHVSDGAMRYRLINLGYL